MKKYCSKFLIIVVLLFIANLGTLIAQNTFDVGFDGTYKIVFFDPTDKPGYAINYYFPESFCSEYTATSVTYSNKEMGVGPRMLTKMKFPFMTFTSNEPADFWRIMVGMDSDTPTDVAIFLRNADKLPRCTGSFDTSAANGWVKVWDGQYDYERNDIEPLYIDAIGMEFPALVVEFAETFFYEGEYLEVVFHNKSGDYPLDDDLNVWYLNYNYPFLCYILNDDYGYGSDNHPGPRYALSYKMIWDWTLYLNNWPYNSHGEDFFYGEGADTYSVYMKEMYPRPLIQFEYTDAMVIDRIIADVPDIVKIDEANYDMIRLNIRTTEGGEIPLKLLDLNLTTGDGSAMYINKAKLYYTEDANEFDFEDAVPIKEFVFEDLIQEPDYSYVISLDTPLELIGGNNYFWLVYEIPTYNSCGDILSMRLESIKVRELNTILKEVPVKFLSSEPIEYSPVNILAPDIVNHKVCKKLGSYTINLAVEGAVNYDVWYYSLDGNYWNVVGEGDDFAEGLEGNRGINKNVELTIDEFIYPYYKYVAIGPNGCEKAIDSCIIEIEYIDPIGEVNIEYVGDKNLNEKVREGEILNFVANVENAPPAVPTSYKWQIKKSTLWEDIPVAEFPSANTKELELIVDTRNYYGFLRCVVEQIDAEYPESCQLTYISNELNFDVEVADFFFTEQPKIKSTICEGEDFEIYAAYYGSIVSAKWQHNGEDIYDKAGNLYTSQILNIKNVDISDAGLYSYVVEAYAKDDNGRLTFQTFTTRPAELFVIDGNYIFKQPEAKTYAEMNSSVILEFIADVKGEYEYQWYKRTVSGDIELKNNYKYKGTKANALVINYLNADDYTYNGEYYYCKITGQCNVVNTEPSYLFTKEEQLFITKQPQDVNICANKNIPIVLSVDILQKDKKLAYQWYKNATLLIDDARISGATTNVLIIDPAQPMDSDKYWVVVKDINSGVEVKSNEVDVTVKEFTLKESVFADPIINAQSGSDFTLFSLKFNAAGDSYTFEMYLNDSLIDRYDRQIPSVHGIVEIESNMSFTDFDGAEEAGTYEMRWYHQCDTIVHIVKVIWVDADGKPIETIVSGVKDINNVEFNIVPNPVTSKISLTFESNDNTNTNIALVDISGASIDTIFDGTVQNGLNEFKFDLSKYNLSNGTYFIKFVQGASIKIKPFVYIK